MKMKNNLENNKIIDQKFCRFGHIFCGYPAIGKTSIGGNSIQMEDGDVYKRQVCQYQNLQKMKVFLYQQLR